MIIQYSVFVIIFSLILFIPLIPVFAQAPEIQWEKTYGSNLGGEVQQTSDEGYIIAGAGVSASESVYFVAMVFQRARLVSWPQI
jgi:hypothetical protein